MRHIYVLFTHIRSINNKGEMVITEVCDIVNRLNRTQQREATIIIDCLSGEIEKARYQEVGMTYDDYEEYFKVRYPAQYGQVRALIEAL